MTNLDDLIAEARRHVEELHGFSTRGSQVLEELAEALESVRAEHDAALAAVERVGAFARGLAKGGDDAGAELLLAALDGAPEPEEKP